ncbi:hypothetical protein [Mycolicibacterium parafortuitum]|uniref:All-trans-retinol 13,14-reductase [Candidatus Korarchaeum cryptofilum OPF8] n=1 Tax=Mycolicibacterium parafortuitum TaxID=39692 RepID=A0A375YN70_MYCPF|nr:hypothetical protein [Mycolicibacterium parafortuitum]ORB29081.1 hypothetical protein BST38_16510 [Mycolicibacterium parafortuitum]BBY76904.1 hypothetical protein MPRF_38030 [Mycolicibacterium parafortuitum]SRX82598.1 all-trans-retinol 13,14-reductase [Candidatus Korarchaeum cryptofilum OPF8] [Mycolicibacterium parafortuitum]
MDQWFERSPFIGFIPWIIYWVVADGPSTWMFGAICAVLSTLLLGVSVGFAGLRLLDIVTAVFFTAVTVAGLFVGAQDLDWMDTYATTLSSGVLAVMALASLGFEPFTAQYAPPSAARQDWEETAFRRTNQVLTLMWALVFALIAVLGYLAVMAPATVHVTKAVIPVVVIVGAVGMTLTYPDKAREKARLGAE